MLLPHDGGTKTIRIKFRRYEDLLAKALPKMEKDRPELIKSVNVRSRQERSSAKFIDDATVNNSSEVV